ncbi:hypothetical protein QQG55_39490 [Brugia pahangi]
MDRRSNYSIETVLFYYLSSFLVEKGYAYWAISGFIDASQATLTARVHRHVSKSITSRRVITCRTRLA